MKITIIGAGNAGTTVAADLALKGHEVTLLKTSNKLHNEHFSELLKKQQIIMTENGETHTVDVHITTDMGKAIPGRELLILYIQTNYHEDLIRRISPYLSDGQTVLIEPGYLSTCYFLQHCDRDLTIVEAESSPIDCRIIAPEREDEKIRFFLESPIPCFIMGKSTLHNLVHRCVVILIG